MKIKSNSNSLRNVDFELFLVIFTQHDPLKASLSLRFSPGASEGRALPKYYGVKARNMAHLAQFKARNCATSLSTCLRAGGGRGISKPLMHALMHARTSHSILI